MHAPRQPRSAPVAAGRARRRPHSSAAVTREAPPPPEPRPAWVGAGERKPRPEAPTEGEDHPRRAATKVLRRGPGEKENRDNGGRRLVMRRRVPPSSSRAEPPRSSSIPSRRGGKPGEDAARNRGKSAPPKTAGAAAASTSRVNPRRRKRQGVVRGVPPGSGDTYHIHNKTDHAGVRLGRSETNGRRGGGAHPTPYDALGRQTLRSDSGGASATAQRRWRPADRRERGDSGGRGGGGSDDGSNDDQEWAEQRPAVGGERTWREGGGEHTVSKTNEVGGEEQDPGMESRGWGLKARQEEEEDKREENAGGEGGERSRDAAADGDKDEEDSLDERLPFMLESLKRVALTVQDLQGRCASISQGKFSPPPTCRWTPALLSLVYSCHTVLSSLCSSR